MDAGLAAVLGAAVGGLCTLGAGVLTMSSASRSAAKAQDSLIAATALLMQDDFRHFQVTLAVALDRCDWWTDAELLAQQTGVDDRKLVWAALFDQRSARKVESVASGTECLAYLQSSDNPRSAPTTITNAVADAQGWMDYLMQRRGLMGDKPPTETDIRTMKWTFSLLDVGRRSLETKANRPVTEFLQRDISDILTTCHTVADLLGRQCPQCGP